MENREQIERKEKKEKVPRQSMPEQDPKERTRNFEEVPYGYTTEQALLEASRCIQCKKPGCIAGCPVDVDIPGFIKLIAEGKFLEAAWKLKETNALPAVCGRVCPQEDQCERVCILGKKGDPVAIGRLERFAADYERATGSIQVPRVAEPTGKRVAVVGAGPAGLTIAGDLVKVGHEVTVFEALHKPGGVLIYGIPEFRLPKAIVDAEVSYLEKLGVKIVTDAVIGRLKTVDDLFTEGFEAVFLGVGAGAPVFMNIPGENLSGIYSANEYLTRSNLMKAYRFPEFDTPIVRGKNVAVIGGGNVAMDSVRTALRLGADNAYIIYRRSKVEMPARIEEVHHARRRECSLIF
jgi:glutamate synthase (NADPH/NADH) small chain